MSLIRFLFLLFIWVFSRVFYRFKITMSPGTTLEDFRTARLGFLLNHTTLFEALLAGALPIFSLWRLARHGVIPVADVTMNRPVAAFLIRLLASNVLTITRKRDESWDLFLDSVGPDSVIFMTPEGRMKRPNGLDKDGKPMTVRGGTVDILDKVGKGILIIGYSGGLHHVQVPGGGLPKLFKTLAIHYETIDIEQYLSSFSHFTDPRERKLAICADLDRRRDSL